MQFPGLSVGPELLLANLREYSSIATVVGGSVCVSELSIAVQLVVVSTAGFQDAAPLAEVDQRVQGSG